MFDFEGEAKASINEIESMVRKASFSLIDDGSSSNIQLEMHDGSRLVVEMDLNGFKVLQSSNEHDNQGKYEETLPALLMKINQGFEEEWNNKLFEKLSSLATAGRGRG